MGELVKPEALPLDRFHFEKNGTVLVFGRRKLHWKCDLTEYICAKQPEREASEEDDGGYDSTPLAVNGAAHAIPSPMANGRRSLKTTMSLCVPPSPNKQMWKSKPFY